jgi:hypothetical protein
MQLYFDGWYAYEEDARGCLDMVEDMGAYPVGLVESGFSNWGILYWSSTTLFANHVLDADNAIASVLRRGAAGTQPGVAREETR